MNREELLFYDAYEEFYAMAKSSKAFQEFCAEAFGEDFSQDGFSDIHQINRMLRYIPKRDTPHILDIGCGNGKMLGYLQRRTQAHIYGFDYSKQAIASARELFPVNSEFREGVIGEIDYPQGKFDLIVSMDSIYFAKDMTAFTAQVKRWLKENGVFFVGYQEGDVIPRTKDYRETLLTKALEECGMKYEIQDITRQTYDLLRRKRDTAMAYRERFEAEGFQKWYELLMLQTECVRESLDDFSRKMARYLYVAGKV